MRERLEENVRMRGKGGRIGGISSRKK